MHGYTLLKEVEVPELKTLARLYRHEKSGAQILSLVNDDENKCFGVAFRTPTSDSTGVPHILEHGVLNGSRKYPVKEPFVELLKGSLNTYLNAFTMADKTVYPVASANLKDFYNLADVYMDAVFHPLIPPHILEQEGWHYELESTDSPLEFKGVVFNEMKGAYSSPENRLGDQIQQSLFPDTPYAHDAGGNPKDIPSLTFEQYKGFHQTYYHPSNALIYFYGDDEPEARLEFLDGYLNEFDARAVDADVPLQPPFEEERRITAKYPGGEDGEEGNKSFLTVNWVFPEPQTLEEAFEGDILSHVLLGTQASPLRKALIDSGLGENLAGGGYDDYTRQPTFSVGLKGIRSEDGGKVETLIAETLDRLAREGIDRETVEASLNSIEFSLRENNTGSFPRGLMLLVIALGYWSYGGDPIEPFFYEAPMQAIRARFDAGEPLFENLIKRRLLANTHRATLLLEPDPNLRAAEEAEERARLDAVQAALTPEQAERLVARTHELRRIQETPDSPEDLAKLPFLKLADLDRQNKIIPTRRLEAQGVPVLHHDLFTNGIAYFDLGFNLRAIPQDLLPLVPMFIRCLLGIGTEKETFVQLTNRIGRKIGGLYATHFTGAPLAGAHAAAWLFLRGKGLMSQAADLFDILRDILLTIKLDDRERFRQMVLESKASKESSLVPSGHSYANTRLRARFHEAYWLNEQFSGISSLYFIRALADEIEKDWDGVLAKLERIRALVFNRSAAIASVTLDGDNWTDFQPRLDSFLGDLPLNPAAAQTWTPGGAPPHEGFSIPAQVNYVAKGADLRAGGYLPHGSALVINNYLGTTWLWEKIRVQGGAYGGMSSYDRLTGVYSYISYRDPNLLGTIRNYDGTPDFLASLNLSNEELTKAIIGAIGDLDSYQLPDAKGYTALTRHLLGISDAERQQLREQVLATTPADFKKFGEALKTVRGGSVVVIGSADALNAANAEMGGNWLEIQKIL
jgi:Zn-dependent M16 (insulinase) family peptidase